MKVVIDRKGNAFTLVFDIPNAAGNYKKKTQTYGSPEAAAEAVKQWLLRKWCA
jgi:hypothetical protein